VRDHGLDLDRFAALGLRRRIDEGARHGQAPSRQAASVTMTSTSSDQNEPSLICATATIFCVSARRMRVDTFARPARGPRWTPITFGCGFFSVNTWMALTWSSCVIGLSQDTVSGTALPFSISAGTSILTLPMLSLASPMTFLIAACMDAGVAPAGQHRRALRFRPRSGAGFFATCRRLASWCSLVTQGREIGDHVLDLLGRQHGLALKGRGHPRETLDSIIRRHDRVR